MSINLYEFLKLNDFEGLSLSLVRRFAIQLLYSLKFLKENEKSLLDFDEQADEDEDSDDADDDAK